MEQTQLFEPVAAAKMGASYNDLLRMTEHELHIQYRTAMGGEKGLITKILNGDLPKRRVDTISEVRAKTLNRLLGSIAFALGSMRDAEIVISAYRNKIMPAHDSMAFYSALEIANDLLEQLKDAQAKLEAISKKTMESHATYRRALKRR